jgi:mono/diheme cytochrome c family protein
MQQRNINCFFLCVGLAALSGCNWLPGRPKEEDRWKAPEANKNFADLYSTNCLACHGNDKIIAPSISMFNATYVSIVPKEALHKAIAQGIPGTMMPGYSAAAGGMLTDDQINILVDGIAGLAKENATAKADHPEYAAAPGDAQRGAGAFAQNCAQCHGNDGNGGKAGSVVEASYLSLVSDQYLRSVIIAGRPELGMPGYREYVVGKPMTAEEIADVVGWLASHREGPAPGQSAPPASTAENTQNSQSNQQ